MGNSLGGKRATKVMKINGETMKFKKPIFAGEIIKNYPGHVLLESESVKHFGIRAKPLESQQQLKPKNLYFLVELPNRNQENQENRYEPRRVRSGIHMTAKDRLESLMLARRSVSDLSILKPSSENVVVVGSSDHQNSTPTRLKLRIPKSEMEKLVKESKDEADAAARIVDFYMKNNGGSNNITAGGRGGGRDGGVIHQQQQVHWKSEHGIMKTGGFKSREKRVGFLPVTEGEIQLAVA